MCQIIAIDTNEYEEVDESFLIEESYTVSYSFEDKVWVSFHDYIPDYLFKLRNNQVLSLKNNSIYSHNEKGVFGIYYTDEIFATVLTPVFAPLRREEEDAKRLPIILDSISFGCDIDNNGKRVLDKTLSSISIHNSYQSTIEINLVEYDSSCSAIQNYRNYNVKRVKNNWQFNRFKDDTVIMDERCLIFGIGTIDIVNVDNVSCDKQKARKKRFIDDHFIVVLKYDNKEQLEMNLYDINFEYRTIR